MVCDKGPASCTGELGEGVPPQQKSFPVRTPVPDSVSVSSVIHVFLFSFKC